MAVQELIAQCFLLSPKQVIETPSFYAEKMQVHSERNHGNRDYPRPTSRKIGRIVRVQCPIDMNKQSDGDKYQEAPKGPLQPSFENLTIWVAVRKNINPLGHQSKLAKVGNFTISHS